MPGVFYLQGELALEISWLRPLKGVLIFLTFFGLGVAMLAQPNLGVVTVMHLLNIPVSFVAGAFFISAFMSLITGLRRMNWNAVWISVFIFYTVSAWVWSLTFSMPATAPIAYTLLSSFLTLDVISDVIWGRNGRYIKKR